VPAARHRRGACSRPWSQPARIGAQTLRCAGRCHSSADRTGCCRGRPTACRRAPRPAPPRGPRRRSRRRRRRHRNELLSRWSPPAALTAGARPTIGTSSKCCGHSWWRLEPSLPRRGRRDSSEVAVRLHRRYRPGLQQRACHRRALDLAVARPPPPHPTARHSESAALLSRRSTACVIASLCLHAVRHVQD
jgi:hypothetical protein